MVRAGVAGPSRPDRRQRARPDLAERARQATAHYRRDTSHSGHSGFTHIVLPRRPSGSIDLRHGRRAWPETHLQGSRHTRPRSACLGSHLVGIRFPDIVAPLRVHQIGGAWCRVKSQSPSPTRSTGSRHRRGDDRFRRHGRVRELGRQSGRTEPGKARGCCPRSGNGAHQANPARNPRRPSTWRKQSRCRPSASGLRRHYQQHDRNHLVWRRTFSRPQHHVSICRKRQSSL
jgi:hypothetical protein